MVEYTVSELTVQAETATDLFSPKGLDRGSRLLLESVKNLEYNTVLDWGCGWGALSLWLAVRRPSAQILALDSDIGAVQITKQNAALNALKNLEVIASHGFDDVPANKRFDLIVSHPPTHRGRTVVEDMVQESYARLASGGQLVVVVEARIKPWLARAIKNVFGDYKILKRSPKHVVLRGQKPAESV